MLGLEVSLASKIAALTSLVITVEVVTCCKIVQSVRRRASIQLPGPAYARQALPSGPIRQVHAVQSAARRPTLMLISVKDRNSRLSLWLAIT